MTDKQDWKHGKWFNIETPDAVAIFDDESADCDSIYLMKAGKFSPCRTVFRGDFNHWKNVVGAWLARGEMVLDNRQNKSVPLPLGGAS